MTGGPIRTVFLGSGAFGVGILRRLADHPDVRVVGVVTAPARPAGRTRVPTPTPIESTARAIGLGTILTPERLRAPEAIDAVLALDPGLAVLADYGQIVPDPLLALPHGALNLHPSLLPRHRGATPIPAAILDGDAETGVTLMQMDAGLDTGPIVAQRRLPIPGGITAPELEAALAPMAADLLAGSLGPWLRGDLPVRPQPDDGATLTRPLRREDGRLDVTRPAVELERRIRAFQPWPGAFVETARGRLVVWRAEAAVGGGGVPGTFDREGVAAAGATRLILVEVQPAGGRRMPWTDYLRGHPDLVGTLARPPDAG